jgi:hypothetical protein
MYDILSGKRPVQTMSASRVKYEPRDAWQEAYIVISGRAAQQEADAGAIADGVGTVDPGEVKSEKAKVKAYLEQMARKQLGVSEATLNKIVAEISKRLKKLPEL